MHFSFYSFFSLFFFFFVYFSESFFIPSSSSYCPSLLQLSTQECHEIFCVPFLKSQEKSSSLSFERRKMEYFFIITKWKTGRERKIKRRKETVRKKGSEKRVVSPYFVYSIHSSQEQSVFINLDNSIFHKRKKLET